MIKISIHHILNTLTLFTLTLMLSSCSLINQKPIIKGSIQNNNLIFQFDDPKVVILAYQVNSLELFEKDGLTYKNILSFSNYDGFHEILIKNYQTKDIVDKHAYYILITKEGTHFQTLNFCIKNKILLTQKNSNDQTFLDKCHN